MPGLPFGVAEHGVESHPTALYNEVMGSSSGRVSGRWDMEAAMRVVEHLRLRDVAPVDLSMDLGVSTRTLRKYVITANDLMMGIAHIELRRGGCYHLAVFDEAALDVLMDRDSTPHPAVPETTEGRVSYILGDVLCRTDWVTIDDMARALWVSRNTVTRCLADVDARLARYGLELERRPRYGMCVRGDEDKRRLCFMELVMGDLYCSDGASDCGSPARKGALECVRGMLDDVRECVVSAFENEGGGFPRPNRHAPKPVRAYLGGGASHTSEGLHPLAGRGPCRHSAAAQL